MSVQLLLIIFLSHASFSFGSEKIQVVASFSILADMVYQIGGDSIDLTTLVDIEGDAHVYRARPIDAKKISNADLLVVNGLGFEGWIERLEHSSGFAGRKVVATQNIDVIHGSEDHDHDHGHNDGDDDPHAWHSIKNAQQYVRNIAKALIEVDPENSDFYEQNLLAYLSELEALDQELRIAVNQVPQHLRRVITSHDAFGYLAETYGFQFLSPQGISTESEASAKDVAVLIRQIRSEGIKAIFIENISDDRLMEQIARETSISIGGTLYSGALSSADKPASTYIDLMRHNVMVLLSALE